MRLRFNSRWYEGLVFPIAVVAFAGVGVKYFGYVFTPVTRWFFLALLGLFLLHSGRLLGAFYTQFALPMLLYCCWVFLTCLWSTVPELSLFKAFAMACTVLMFTAAGRYWVSGWTSNPPLFYLAPVAVAALASAFGGKTLVTGFSAGQTVELYQGITGGPNSLGLIVAASSPLVIFLIYKAFSRRSTLLMRAMTVLGALVLAVLLLWSASRSAIIATLAVSSLAVMALRPSKLIAVAILFGFAIGITVIAAPEIQDQAYTRYVLKYSPGGDVLFTRREPWRQSMEGARQGGWFGLGYGAAYGYESFSGGLTSVGYGREKGNSQLAVIEEIGIVGLGFYALLLFSIIWQLIEALRRTYDQETRFQIALVTGLVIGLTLQSCFEGWWTSPGSAESAIFWATVGVGSGLVRRGVLLARFEQFPPPLDPRTTRRPIAYRA